MAFWKTNSVDPVRQFRFKVIDSSGVWWWVKSIDKPSFEVNTGEYQLANHKFKYPGIAVWNDITLIIRDVGDKADLILNSFMPGQGYQSPDDCSTGITKVGHDGKNKGGLQILQYDRTGKLIETWDIYGSFIKSVNFGQLDYGSDDMVEITIVVAYDYAEINGGVGTQRRTQPEEGGLFSVTTDNTRGEN